MATGTGDRNITVSPNWFTAQDAATGTINFSNDDNGFGFITPRMVAKTYSSISPNPNAEGRYGKVTGSVSRLGKTEKLDNQCGKRFDDLIAVDHDSARRQLLMVLPQPPIEVAQWYPD